MYTMARPAVHGGSWVSMKIHELTALELRGTLDSGELSSVEIVEALRTRSAKVDGPVRGFVHHFWESALSTARRCDDERARGDALGPLHGIPFTVKENVDTKGVASSLGMASQLTTTASKDADVVRVAKANGAILIGKTNVPQTLLLGMETDNRIWGRSSNPWSARHACGGSSGGEAVVLSTGQSPLGIGTDLGGSLRFPAHFCGVASLKPTAHRWSNVGIRSSLRGQEVVQSQVGPMARTSRDVAFLFGALSPTEMGKHDPAVAPIKLHDPACLRPETLRVGIHCFGGFLEPSASVLRALEEAARHLEAAGVTVVPFHAPEEVEVSDLFFAAVTADGGETVGDLLGDEAPVAVLAGLRKMVALPSQLRNGLAQATGLWGEGHAARVLRQLGAKSAHQLWQLAARRTELRRMEFAVWNEQELDAVIAPVHMTAACLHGQSAQFAPAGAFSARYNVLDFPAGCVPVTRVKDAEAIETPRSGRSMLNRKAGHIEKASAGLPVGVQVVAKPHQDEVALRVMQLIEDGARAKAAFPWTPIDPSVVD